MSQESNPRPGLAGPYLSDEAIRSVKMMEPDADNHDRAIADAASKQMEAWMREEHRQVIVITAEEHRDVVGALKDRLTERDAEIARLQDLEARYARWWRRLTQWAPDPHTIN